MSEQASDIWPYVCLAPRPLQPRLGMTRLGVMRDEYNATVEGHPPRWIMTPYGYVSNGSYFAWTKRADAWCVDRQGVES